MTTLVPRLWTELTDWLDQDSSMRGGMIRLEDRLSESEYTIRAELPGIDPEKHVQINVSNGIMTIQAERREELQAQHRSEFRYGVFQRSVRLPSTADEEGVRAHYSQGILEITVPLKAQPAAKRVAITKD